MRTQDDLAEVRQNQHQLRPEVIIQREKIVELLASQHSSK